MTTLEHHVKGDDTRITEDGLLLRLGLREFGTPASPGRFAAMANMEVPSSMDALSSALFRQSKLMVLQPDASPAQVVDAYGHDLQLMQRYRRAFEHTIRLAVLAQAETRQPEARAFLAHVLQEVSGVVHEPTLDMSPEMLRLATSEQQEKLCAQLHFDIEMLKRSIATWLHVLVESDLVCLIDRLNDTSFRYHFFRLLTTKTRGLEDKEVEGRQHSVEGWTERFTADVTTQIVSERRLHTVVNATPYSLEQFPERVPQRIANLIDGLPAEVRPFVSIISGVVTREEVVHRTMETRVERETRSIFHPDPVVALFDTFGIAGYGGTSNEVALSVYTGHASVRTNRMLVGAFVGTTAAAVGATALAGLRTGVLVFGVGTLFTVLHQLGRRLERKRTAD